MANLQQVELIREGTEVWNRWRFENDNIRPDLGAAYLREANLIEANLGAANLSGANLGGADLRRANLGGG
jgi:uncharacterized protein YjbI with pentapeptide repeats